MASTNKIRVLLIAEAANPEWVSVPLVGWSHGQALAQVAQVHRVTQVRNRDAFLRAGMVEGLPGDGGNFTAIDSEPVAKPIYKMATLLRGGKGKGWTTVTALGALPYYYFEHQVWRQFGAALKRGEYDVVHRLTPLTPTSPSLLAKRCKKIGVPFVLGPLNGGVPWPRYFNDRRNKEREWLSYVRSAYKLLPYYKSTRKHASAILVASGHTREQLPTGCEDRTFYVPENGIDPARFSQVRQANTDGPLRAVYLGRLVAYKGADMLLDAALPLLREGKMTLEIVGDGPMRDELNATIAEHGVDDAVTMHGWVEHDQVQHLLAKTDVLASPSIREFGGGVVLEAMAIGVVPVVANYGGPAELVTPKTGIAVTMGEQPVLVAGFREALQDLADNREKLEAMSIAARRRAFGCFSWDAKAQVVRGIYEWVLGRGKKPMLPMPVPDPEETVNVEMHMTGAVNS